MQYLKKVIVTLILAAGLMSSATSVFASNLHLLLGADYVKSSVKYRQHSNRPGEHEEKDFDAVSGVIGLSAYGIGLEAFVLNSDIHQEEAAGAVGVLNSDNVSKDSLRGKLRAFGIDVYGEANLSDNFALVASLGLAKYRLTSYIGDKKTEDSCNGPRFGIGLQYYLTNNLALITMYHYTLLNAGENDAYDAVGELSAGIRIIF